MSSSCSSVPKMHLRVLVVAGAGRTPEAYELSAERGQVVGDLRRALHLAPDQHIVYADTALADDQPIGSPPLLDGATLRITDTPPPASAARGAHRPLRLLVTAGPDAGRCVPLDTAIRVGRSAAAELPLDDPSLSRLHLRISPEAKGVLVTDLGSTNGARLDGEPLTDQPAPMQTGQRLTLGSTEIVLAPAPGRGPPLPPTGEGTLETSPHPRVISEEAAPTIEFPAEPEAPRRRRMPWAMLLLPVPFAVLLAIIFDPRMMILGLLSPVMILGSTLSERIGGAADHRAERREWAAAVHEARRRLALALVAEFRERHRAAPDPATTLLAATGPTRRLWERRVPDRDALHVRLGLATLAAKVSAKGAHGASDHPPLARVPVTVDLRASGVLGCAGPTAAALGRSIVGQLATWHSPTELDLTLIATTASSWVADYEALPHLRSDPGRPATSRCSTTSDEAARLVTALASEVTERTATRDTHATWLPQVVVVDDPSRLRDDGPLHHILDHGPAVGIYTVLIAPDLAALPPRCGAVVTVAEGGTAHLAVAGGVETEVCADLVGAWWAERLTAALAPLRDTTPRRGHQALPRSVRFVDLLGIDPDSSEDLTRLRHRHQDLRRGLAVPIGAGQEGACLIDLVADGPHALLGGTTGSGKSELLQTWVASLAAHLTTDEVTFVLVDYKGGAAFGECAHLPHTVGMVTDLDAAAARRALTSLGAELTRRERLLAEVGAADIEAYRRRSDGIPLPRLVLIIDEFRMLAEDQPEVLQELIKIAALGRSLGIHLVLATQRPGGIVSADVRANVNLRIALRVRDRTDSDDVLGSPLAAAIDERTPGRAYQRTGSGPPVAFQAGRVAGREPSRRAGPTLRRVGDPEPPPLEGGHGPMDLHRLVATITAVERARGAPAPHRPWLPPLPARITDDALPPAPAVVWGLIDDPALQRREPLLWDPADAHLMIVGGPGTGRTTAVASLITRVGERRPAVVHAIGDGSPALLGLREWPHVGSVVDANDEAVLARLIRRLRRDLDDRAVALRASGHSSMNQWWEHEIEGGESPTGAGGSAPPVLVLAIDNWQLLSDPTSGDLMLEAAGEIEAIAREGLALGVRLVVTGGRELLVGRIASSIARRVVLSLPDPTDAALAGIPRASVPGTGIAGRGVLTDDLRTVQVALPPSAPPAGAGPARSPWHWSVGELPSEVSYAEITPTASGYPLGIGGDDGTCLTWSPSESHRWLIAGPSRSGRTTALITMARGLLDAGTPVIVVAREPIPSVAGPTLVGALGPHDRDELIRLIEAYPRAAVLIDDADRMSDTPVEDVLTELTRIAESRGSLVVATSTTSAANRVVRGLVAEVARGRCGVLLSPTRRSDGDAFGVRVPPLQRRPGRGYLILDGEPTEIQLAR